MFRSTLLFLKSVSSAASLFDGVPVRAMYVWCSGKDSYHDIRGKEKTVFVKPEIAAEIAACGSCSLTSPSKGLFGRYPPLKPFDTWSFDGSSTGQAKGLNTEIFVKPVRSYVYPDDSFSNTASSLTKDAPMRVVVLCECFTPEGKETDDNTRAIARKVFESPKGLELKPWFGLEQEYILYKNGRPLGWPESYDSFPAPQGPYYCGYGGDRAFGREIVDRHYDLCTRMGLTVSGINAEVTPGQWEFQVGPSEGLDAGDHMLVARWLFARILEDFSARDKCVYTVNYEPKPIKGDWNGSGMHCNFSTTETREAKDGQGFKAIMSYVERMKHTIKEDIAAYGKNNEERLSGKHETSRFDEFSFGIGTRTTSVRVPNSVKAKGFGWLEDRRPGANADPYLVTSRLFCSATGFKL